MKFLARDRKINKIFQDKLKDNHKCRGCGSIRNLTASHLIKRSRRPDLITAKYNITVHCVRCHDKWENVGEASCDFDYIRNMFDFDKNLEYIEITDKRFFLEIQLLDQLN